MKGRMGLRGFLDSFALLYNIGFGCYDMATISILCARRSKQT
jgi:hypothetical protein